MKEKQLVEQDKDEVEQRLTDLQKKSTTDLSDLQDQKDKTEQEKLQLEKDLQILKQRIWVLENDLIFDQGINKELRNKFQQSNVLIQKINKIIEEAVKQKSRIEVIEKVSVALQLKVNDSTNADLSLPSFDDDDILGVSETETDNEFKTPQGSPKNEAALRTPKKEPTPK